MSESGARAVPRIGEIEQVVVKKIENNESAVKVFVEKIIDVGVDGVGPVKGARQIAEEHLSACSRDTELAIGRLIATHARIVGVSGFATGLGGLIILPVTIPTDLTVFYGLAARCVGAIAHLRGWDISSDEVRSLILVSLLGAAGAEILKEAGVKIGTKSALAALKKLPGKVLIEINKKVGFRLLTKFGEKGVVNLVKFVPVAGGVAGGAANLVSMRIIGRWAKSNFPPLGADGSDSAESAEPGLG